jgi:arylsulfatase A-like enzyme
MTAAPRIAVTLVKLGTALLVVVLAVLLAANRATERATAVVIVTLDTTRADRLSPYGFMDVRMPSLERLAAEGVVFDQAITVAPLTLPAHASLLTGLLPPAHGVRDNADRPLAADVTTLAETLRTRGFRTGAFVGSVVLQADRGLAQGFEVYRDVKPIPGEPSGYQRRGDAVVDEAIAWLEGAAGSSFLLWTHLYDPHVPYDPPAAYRDAHTDPYVGELLFADAQVGRLLDALDRLDIADRTMVVVLADHGEGLGDHGEQTHGLRLYDTVLRVPMIVRLPGVVPGRQADLVRIVDLAPTILDVLRVPHRGAYDGISLLPALEGRSVDVEAYAESLYAVRMGGEPIRALRDGRYKLIDGPEPELYDLHTDPFEVRNVISDKPHITRAMRGRLHAISGASAPSPRRNDVPAELRHRLDALGYISGTPGRSP